MREKRPSAAKDLLSGYLHHKVAREQKPITRADLLFGVPLSLALFCGMLFKLRNALKTGVLAYSARGDSVVHWSESPVFFTFVFLTGALLAICFGAFAVMVVLKFARRLFRG